ncbi:MAG: helix-turn-helix domain-containing protein [Terriglobia bacterium]
MSEYHPSLREELSNEEYRYAYDEDFLNTYVATQIRVLREQRGLKQEELAKLIGTKQSGVSRLENVNYSAWKTDTLRKVARALGVRLRISFETFGSLLGDSAKFSPQNLQRPRFEEDPAFSSGYTPAEERSLLEGEELGRLEEQAFRSSKPLLGHALDAKDQSDNSPLGKIA